MLGLTRHLGLENVRLILLVFYRWSYSGKNPQGGLFRCTLDPSKMPSLCELKAFYSLAGVCAPSVSPLLSYPIAQRRLYLKPARWNFIVGHTSRPNSFISRKPYQKMVCDLSIDRPVIDSCWTLTGHKPHNHVKSQRIVLAFWVVFSCAVWWVEC